jgi:two-component system copper resistance phosphate regulon response regulator CusR
MKALVVDDEEGIREILAQNLRMRCFVVDTANDGTDGSYLARTNQYDIILLDNMLPEKTGIQICKEIRLAGRTTPIIVLSVLTDTWRKVDLLNAGADDYVVKPFAFEEIMARIYAVLRRPADIGRELLSIDDLTLNTVSQRVERNSTHIHVTRKEFMLLEYLMRNEGVVLSRGMILERLWDRSKDPFSNTIDAHIRSLRRKVDLPGSPRLIHTVCGRGYKVDRM